MSDDYRQEQEEYAAGRKRSRSAQRKARARAREARARRIAAGEEQATPEDVVRHLRSRAKKQP